MLLGHSVCVGLLRGRGAGILRGGLGIVCLHGGGRRMPFMRGREGEEGKVEYGS